LTARAAARAPAIPSAIASEWSGRDAAPPPLCLKRHICLKKAQISTFQFGD